MRLAAIYDIYGNLPALEAVLADIASENVDLIVVGGDVVAGPMPSETLALLQDVSVNIPTQFIHGNAESEVNRFVAGKEIGGLTPQADDVTRWVASCLTPAQKEFIASWSTTLTIELHGLGEVLFCHATPANDIDVFTSLTPDARMLSLFNNVTASLVVCGHTHMQFARIVGDIRVVNGGSVGMPFGKTSADWLLIDREVVFNHTDYDRAKAAARIRQTDYPGAETFAANNVLTAPSEAQALQMLSRLEAMQAEKR